MIKLTDFLWACKVPVDLSSYKIHLATGVHNPPLEAFFDGRFKEWQENQKNKNFSRKMVIGLIHLDGLRWLFAGVYCVLGVKSIAGDRWEYSTELLEGQEKLIGRVVVEHKRSARAAYLIGKPDGGDFLVSEIRAQPMTIEQNLETWRGALSNMKGVYLITDLTTGHLYVGSATGNEGIWQRWGNYVSTGHGGNQELRRVLREHGIEYVENFQYSLLEIADSRASDEYVLERESFWKNVFASREFGYNAN